MSRCSGVIENMSYYCCPNCGHRADIFGHGGARAEAAKMGVEFLGELPLKLDIRVLADAGTPIVAARPETEEAQAYRRIAARLWAKLNGAEAATAGRGSWWSSGSAQRSIRLGRRRHGGTRSGAGQRRGGRSAAQRGFQRQPAVERRHQHAAPGIAGGGGFHGLNGKGRGVAQARGGGEAGPRFPKGSY